MDLRPITESVAVAPQIRAEDVAEIARRGYRAIICNRPDGEEPGQTPYARIAAAAEAAGLSVLHQPVISGQVARADAAAFGAALRELPGPVVAYCRSGTRCAVLWALSEAGRRDPAQIVGMARRAGYDLSWLPGAGGGA